MSKPALENPVEDSVPKINDEVAVGEDLEFQRRWWKFERAAWSVIALLLLLDLAGVFGRGPAANAQQKNASMQVHYERVERADSPSMLRIQLDPSTFHDGKAQLFVSQSVVEHLGAQRIIPAPVSSRIGNGGITYTFDTFSTPGIITFALAPDRMGVEHFTLQVPGCDAIQGRVIVVP